MLLLLCCVLVLCSDGGQTMALNFPSQVYSDNVKFESNFPLDPEFTKLEDFEIVTSSDEKYSFYGFSKDREFCFGDVF